MDQSILRAALAGISLIEAGDEREEALSLAIAMRELLESPNKTAALVTPDRELARRVCAELRRWGVNVDDSAGDPLSVAPAGVLARLAIACAAESASAASLAALIAHPSMRLGFFRAEMERLAPLLEIGVLRSAAGGARARRLLGDPAGAISIAKSESGQWRAHPARRRICQSDWARLEDLLQRLAAALKPMLDLEGEHGLADWLRAHKATLAAIVAAEDAAPLSEDREALEALFDELDASATEGMKFDARILRVLLRRCRPRDQAARARKSAFAAQDFGSARSAADGCRSDAARRSRRDGLAAASERRRLPQPADARGARTDAARAKARANSS